MNVVDVSNSDIVGGAGIAAFPSHRSLKRVGIESRCVEAMSKIAFPVVQRVRAIRFELGARRKAFRA
jgi:hypothetical protein